MLIMVMVMVIRFLKVVAFALDQSAHYPFMLGATNIQRQVNVDYLDCINDDDDDKMFNCQFHHKILNCQF